MENHQKLELSVLIVDDEQNILRVYETIFNRRFQHVFTADNGEKGLQIYKDYKPDIIISDIQMPVMNGLAMCREIRALNSEVPIILITAYNDSKYLLSSADLNVEHYVIKPVQQSELVTALDKATKKAFTLKNIA